MNAEERKLDEITPADLDGLLGREEHQHLDFKETLGDTPKSKYEIAKDIACFANGGGGLIVVGAVEDRATNKCVGFRSVSNPKGIREKIEQIALDRVEERLSVTPRVMTTNRGEVVVLALVPRAKRLVAVINDHGEAEYWQRSGRNNRRMAHSEVMAALGTAQQGDLDENGTIWNSEWVRGHRAAARDGLLRATGSEYFFEAYFDFSQGARLAVSQAALFRAARDSYTKKLGYWPIGFVGAGRAGPQPRADEIVLEIPDAGAIGFGCEIPYTYWALNEKAQFYTLQGYLEDLEFKRGSTSNRFLFTDWRLAQTTDLMLYATRLFRALRESRSGLVSPAVARFHMHYSGLKGRILSAARQGLMFIPHHPPAAVDAVFSETAETTELLEREADRWLPTGAERLTASLFGLFGFFQMKPQEYQKMVGYWCDWFEGRIG